MINKRYLIELYRSGKNIFTFKELMLLWDEKSVNNALSRISYYVSQKQLFRLRKGIYAIKKDYNIFELATKIYKPSYISFETVLANEGIIFQHYKSIFLASYQTKEIECDGNIFSFKKLKDSVLYNISGIINKDDIIVATKERAFLDVIYLNKDYYFDNLKNLDFEVINSLIEIYDNKRIIKEVKKYYKLQKNSI